MPPTRRSFLPLTLQVGVTSEVLIKPVVSSLALSNCMTVSYVSEKGMPRSASCLHRQAACAALTSIYGLIKDRVYDVTLKTL